MTAKHEMTTKNLIIGFAALAIVLGAWSIYSGKGVPWHQQSKDQQRGQGQQRSGQGRSGQQSGRQTSGQQGRHEHDEHEEPEGDPADWEQEDLKVWLENVSVLSRLTSSEHRSILGNIAC